MANYKELRDGYEFVRTSGSTNGVRVFIDETGGTDVLPSIGDPISIAYPLCKCLSIKEEMYHFESGVCKKKYICTYSTVKKSIVVGVLNTDEDQMLHTGGERQVSIGGMKNYYIVKRPWNALVVEAQFQDKVGYRTVQGTISKTILIDTDGDHSFNNFAQEQIFKKLGRINSEPLSTSDGWALDYKKGTVLFSNYNARLVLDEQGDKKWEVTLNFAYRILQIPQCNDAVWADQPGGTNIQYSWNFSVATLADTDPDPTIWNLIATKDLPVDLDNDYLYKAVDFMSASTHFDGIFGVEI